MKKETAVNRLVNYLVGVIQSYSVGYRVEASHNLTSNSKYIYIFIKRRRFIFRISDHALPKKSIGNTYNSHAEAYYDFRPSHYQPSKDALIKLFQTHGIEHWNAPLWAINLKRIVKEYEANLAQQANPEYYRRWSYFLYTIRAISNEQRKKLYRKTFPEVLVQFKMPKDIPPFINRIFNKYT